MLVALSQSKSETPKSDNVKRKKKSGPSNAARTLHAQKGAKTGRCAACSGDHFVLWCDSYKKKQLAEKKKFVESNGLCLNCLGKHALDNCTSTKSCVTYSERHHSTFHDVCPKQEQLLAGAAVSSHVTLRTRAIPSMVLLATARVLVADAGRSRRNVRAMVDPCSEVSLVAESLVQRLRVPRSSTTTVIYGVGAKRSGAARGTVRLLVSSRFGGSDFAISALILPRLTCYDRRTNLPVEDWSHVRGLELADPELGSGNPIELLLGADVYSEILRTDVRHAGSQFLVAQSTTLGWILTEKAGVETVRSSPSVRIVSVESELFAQVRAFWEVEELPQPVKPMSEEERRCEELYARTVVRDVDGRYTVRLPTTADMPDFSNSHRAALGSWSAMERRFKVDPGLKRKYSEFMQEYLILGHMRQASAPVGPNPGKCFLPHHGVIKVTNSTPKLRVMFNGSSRLPWGDTLNEHLLVGPGLVPLLADVLLRWRRHRFVVATDIEKMYRQMRVHPDDQQLQRILWREPGGEAEVTKYALTTVTYGLSCAPYLAVHTLLQLATNEETRFPRGAAAIRRDSYVDDILSGADTEGQALDLRGQLVQLCEAGGFPLRKWAANSGGLLEGIPDGDRASGETISWTGLESHSTLGFQWYPRDDCFAYRIRNIGSRHETDGAVANRRTVRSVGLAGAGGGACEDLRSTDLAAATGLGRSSGQSGNPRVARVRTGTPLPWGNSGSTLAWNILEG